MIKKSVCCVDGCGERATKYKIIFGIYYPLCKDHNTRDISYIDLN